MNCILVSARHARDFLRRRTVREVLPGLLRVWAGLQGRGRAGGRAALQVTCHTSISRRLDPMTQQIT